MSDDANRQDALALIVEDEPDNREIIRTVVEDLLGFRAALASNGEEAISLAVLLRPKVVVMDLMMPVMDGYETIKRLRADERTANLPIIAITALGRPTDRQRALDTGATDYLSKPFDLDELAAMISKYVTRNT